jgi:hypothetical protein
MTESHFPRSDWSGPNPGVDGTGTVVFRPFREVSPKCLSGIDPLYAREVLSHVDRQRSRALPSWIKQANPNGATTRRGVGHPLPPSPRSRGCWGWHTSRLQIAHDGKFAMSSFRASYCGSRRPIPREPPRAGTASANRAVHSGHNPGHKLKRIMAHPGEQPGRPN